MRKIRANQLELTLISAADNGRVEACQKDIAALRAIELRQNMALQHANSVHQALQARNKALEKALATSSLLELRDANCTLNEKLELAQAEIKALQAKLVQRDPKGEIAALEAQLKLLVNQPATSASGSSGNAPGQESSSSSNQDRDCSTCALHVTQIERLKTGFKSFSEQTKKHAEAEIKVLSTANPSFWDLKWVKTHQKMWARVERPKFFL